MRHLKAHTLSLLTFTSCLYIASAGEQAFSKGQDITITDGKGEEISIKNGLFSSKKKVVKDRLGNKYESSKGIFGSKKTDLNLLGNSVSVKKGIFGGTEVQGSSILGDSVTTKKGIFGHKKTTVDLSGVSSLVDNLMGKTKANNLSTPNQLSAPSSISGPSPSQLSGQPEQFPSELPDNAPGDR